MTNYTDGDGKWALPNDETTIYARWTPDSYTLTYNCGTAGGTAPVDSNSPYTYNTSVTLLSPINCNSGSNFTGWLCGGTNYAENGSLTMVANTTCTAQWSAYPIITFDVNAANATLNGTSPLYLNYTADLYFHIN